MLNKSFVELVKVDIYVLNDLKKKLLKLSTLFAVGKVD